MRHQRATVHRSGTHKLNVANLHIAVVSPNEALWSISEASPMIAKHAQYAQRLMFSLYVLGAQKRFRFRLPNLQLVNANGPASALVRGVYE